MTRISDNAAAKLYSSQPEAGDVCGPAPASTSTATSLAPGSGAKSSSVEPFSSGSGTTPQTACEAPTNGQSISAALLSIARGVDWSSLQRADGPVAHASTSTDARKSPAAPELKRGLAGGAVAVLQRALNEAGAGLRVDRSFGRNTEAAVRVFQESHPPLRPTGVVDAATWAELAKAAPKAMKDGVPTEAAKALREYPVTHTDDGTPRYVQGDARWGAKKIGLSAEKNLHQVGCALTCVAMALSKQLGRDVTPGELNDVLVKYGAFDGASLIWAKASAAIEAEYGVALPMDRKPDTMSGATINSTLDAELAAGRPAILHIDHKNEGKPNHWVLIQRKEGDDFIALDPGSGRETRYRLNEKGDFVAMSSSGKPITPEVKAYGVTVFNDPPKPAAKPGKM